jgi:hypothetical protein
MTDITIIRLPPVFSGARMKHIRLPPVFSEARVETYPFIPDV